MSKRQTIFFLPVNPLDKEHKDLDTIDLGAPRLAQYMQTAWKKHQNTVVLGRHQSCSKERIEVLSDAIERHHSLRNTPSLLYPESCMDGNWRSHIRKSIHVTSTSTKDLLETRLEKRLGLQFEDYALKSIARAFASRSKAKTKPQRRTSASSSTRTIPIEDRTWTEIEPQDYSLNDYSVSKKHSLIW